MAKIVNLHVYVVFAEMSKRQPFLKSFVRSREFSAPFIDGPRNTVPIINVLKVNEMGDT
jgi:hypothetical protein